MKAQLRDSCSNIFDNEEESDPENKSDHRYLRPSGGSTDSLGSLLGCGQDDEEAALLDEEDSDITAATGSSTTYDSLTHGKINKNDTESQDQCEESKDEDSPDQPRRGG